MVGATKPLGAILLPGINIITKFPQPLSTPGLRELYCGLWVLCGNMSMQALISNKYPSVGRDARNGEECMNEGRDTWEISALFIQFL